MVGNGRWWLLMEAGCVNGAWVLGWLGEWGHGVCVSACFEAKCVFIALGNVLVPPPRTDANMHGTKHKHADTLMQTLSYRVDTHAKHTCGHTQTHTDTHAHTISNHPRSLALSFNVPFSPSINPVFSLRIYLPLSPSTSLSLTFLSSVSPH